MSNRNGTASLWEESMRVGVPKLDEERKELTSILEQLDLSNSSVVYVRVQTAEVVNGSLNEAFVTFFLGCIAGYGYDLAFISLSVQFFNGFLTGFFRAHFKNSTDIGGSVSSIDCS